MNIRRDDTVIVLSGDDKGAKGKVIAVSPKEGSRREGQHDPQAR